MRFKFRLEFLLNHRERQRDEAKRIYFEAQAKVDEILKKIEDMYFSIEESRRLVSRELSTYSETSVPTSFLVEDHINHMKIKIDQAKKEARDLMIVAEEKHEDLIEATKELKIIEKLREKKLAEFKKEKLKKEAKDLDDMMLMRHRRVS